MEGGQQKSNKFVRFMQAFGLTFGALMSFLFFIIVLVIVIALFVPSEDLSGGNVAVVPITGTITTGAEGDLLEDFGTDSATIVEWIKQASEDEGTKAIILEIDSPGGSPVATDEISRAVKEANKTVIAVIRESGTSGAFWIATSANYVFANRMSITGSIGVVGSHLEFSGLLEDYNITYRRLVSGKYKDAGSRWKEMTPEEQALFQKLLDEIHLEFIKEVADNRKLPIATVQELADGFVFTGARAKELGLIDALGSKDDAVKHIEKELGITAELYEFEPSKTLFEEALGISSYHAGRGIGETLFRTASTESVQITT